MTRFAVLLLLILPAVTSMAGGQQRVEDCVRIESDTARLRCFDSAVKAGSQSNPSLGEEPQFSGSDPGAGSSGPRPNSDRAAAAFDDASRKLGSVNIITFETAPNGPFNSLEVARGVSVSQKGTTTEGGIVNGCFLSCSDDVRRGYNVTPGGKQYLGIPLVFEVGTATIDFSFATPIQSFGAYVIGLGTANGDLFIEFNDGKPRLIAVKGDARGGSQFVGFTSPGAAIGQVRLVLRNVAGGSRDNFSLDDIRYTPRS
jgi:hypothetical protein